MTSRTAKWNPHGRWCPDKLLLDPYAPLVWGRVKFGVRDEVEEFKQKVSRIAYAGLLNGWWEPIVSMLLQPATKGLYNSVDSATRIQPVSEHSGWQLLCALSVAICHAKYVWLQHFE